MDDFYSRREIMESYHISRRVIEGYEKTGLIRPSKNNERGDLLYDRKTVLNIGFIRLCQKMGFKLKDVKEIIDIPEHRLKERLKEQADTIRKQLTDLKYILNVTCYLSEHTEDPRTCEYIYELFKEGRI